MFAPFAYHARLICLGAWMGEPNHDIMASVGGLQNRIKTALRGVVAVVDDDPEILEALGAWLDQSGVQASLHGSAESLVHALALSNQPIQIQLQADSPEVEPLGCVILDLSLPGVNGLNLAWALRGHHPDLPMVMISAHDPAQYAQMGRLPPGMASLQKPIDLDALEVAMLAALH